MLQNRNEMPLFLLKHVLQHCLKVDLATVSLRLCYIALEGTFFTKCTLNTLLNVL
jgi:hypothetical protein